MKFKYCLCNEIQIHVCAIKFKYCLCNKIQILSVQYFTRNLKFDYQVSLIFVSVSLSFTSNPTK